MQINKKIITGLALSAILVTQASYVNASKQIEDKETAFMTINDKEVTEQKLYDSITLNASYGPALEVVDMKVLKEKYGNDNRLKEIIDAKYKEAAEQSKEDDKDMRKAFKSYGAMDREDYIEKSGLLLESYRELARIDTSYDEIFSKKEKNYVYEHKFSADADLYHLLVPFNLSSVDNGNEEATEKAQKEALANAEKIIAEIDGGLTFQDAVKKYSADKMNDDGKLGNFNVNSAKEAKIAQPIINEAFSLKDGEYSKKPIKSDFGYEIVMVKVTKDKETYENLKNDVAKKLYDIYFQNNQYIAPYALDIFRTNNKIEFYDSNMSKAYANAKLNNRQSYLKYDPEAQQNQFGQGF